MENYSSLVLWLGQFFLTLFPAWFLYSLFSQAKRSGYRERSALPFAAALFIWTIAGAINAFSAFKGSMPFFKYADPLISSEVQDTLNVIRVLLSTINTLLLTVGATRLDNFPKRFGGRLLRERSNRWWTITAALALIWVGLGGYFVHLGFSRMVDVVFGFGAAIPITAGLYVTFRRYEMGKILTAAIVSTLWLLEVVLVKLAVSGDGSSQAEALFLTSVMVTSKVAFMMVLVMVSAAWGQYYTSGTIEELKKGASPQRVRPLFEVIPGENIAHARRNAYQTMFMYWPDSPALMEAIKTEGPASKEVAAAVRNPQMIADLIDAGILNLTLTHVGDGVTTEVMNASMRGAEGLNGRQERRQA